MSLPGPLREFAAGRSVVQLQGPLHTVADALAVLRTEFPAIHRSIVTEQGELRPHVNLFVGMDNVRAAQGLATPLPPDADLVILPAVSGG